MPQNSRTDILSDKVKGCFPYRLWWSRFFRVGPIMRTDSGGKWSELVKSIIADVPGERMEPICGGVLVDAKGKRRKPCFKPG